MGKVFVASLLCAFIILISCLSNVSCEVMKFPDEFKFGVGTSAYQVEGSWQADGKGESIWDHMTHFHSENIEDGSSADRSSESYKNWKRDVQLVKELNVDIYRFSIAWTRILPDGMTNKINKAGINYYNNLINELLHHNITPMVTIYHWDLPNRLQELGGWTNPEIIDIFVDYAKIVLDNFGDRVKFWTTFNEPWHVCEQAYGQDYMAPAINYPGIPSYLCGHNLLKAHAKVYHVYKNQYKHQNGVMGITADTSFPEPLTHTHDDRKASERALQFYVGWFMNPIFGANGNYPKIMIDRIDELSRIQGFSKSRLPKFTDAEVKMIHNTSDFFGINSYTSVLVTTNDDRKNPANHPIPSFFHDMGTMETQDDTWPTSGSVWLRVHPNGMRHLLNWIKKEYNNPPVYVTENGVSDKGGRKDQKRVDYFNSYLIAIHQAINRDGCNVRGYIAWSLMDSFEWKAGFTEKFGLYHVDFESPNRTRTAKLSALVYAQIAKTKQIDRNYQPSAEVTAELFTSGSVSDNRISLTLLTSVVATLLFKSLKL